MSSTAPRLAVVVLAAGKGKRMKSKLPKVLHPLCGEPALWHVLQAAAKLRPDKIVIVVSFGREQIEATVASFGLKVPIVFADQKEPRGTGHAVMAAEKAVGKAERVLVLAGDEPLHRVEDLRALLALQKRRNAAAAIVTVELPDATGYGRVIRDDATLVRIAEEKDATPAERQIREVATMAYVFRRKDLYAALPKVGTDNRQKEYYLPDTLSILRDAGEKVLAMVTDMGGALGINSRAELAGAATVLRRRINAAHMANGVSLVDPDQTYIDARVKIDDDATILPQTYLEGATRIGADCEIGPATRIRDSIICDGTSVSFSVMNGAEVGEGCIIGPYAHIRPGTTFSDGARAGAYVEIKGSKIGPGSKVPHLSYVGDATLGANVNIGAGTVTVNYDGYDKHATVIGDDARVGSDSMLVAPVRIGKGAVTGAGSVITRDVPAGALAVERGEQRQVKGYRDRKDAEAGRGRAGAAKAAKAGKASKKSTKAKKG